MRRNSILIFLSFIPVQDREWVGEGKVLRKLSPDAEKVIANGRDGR